MPRNSQVNYYLKPPGPDKKSLIFLQFKYHGQRLVYSFGQRVHPSNWNGAKQQVKNVKETTAAGDYLLNDLLKNLAEICEAVYKKELATGVPSTQTLRNHLDNFFKQNGNDENKPTLFGLIDRFIAGEIKYKGKDKSKGSLNNYHSVKTHLQKYEKAKGEKVNFDSITLDFFYKYASFLKTFIKPNTAAKSVRLLKVFMNEAVDLGYTTNLQFKHNKFTLSGEDTDAVYLTFNEIVDLNKHDFTGNKKLEQVRDLFVFGCFVGLRYSDYSTVKPENIINDDGDMFIKMITKKTKELVIIPCNPLVKEIFEKYKANKNNLPNTISNQKFNEYVKEVCQTAELNQTGRLSSDPEKPLFECITSHTARRSFATNYYLEGFPTIDLMKITGHKTERAFMKYIRVSKLDTAKRLSQHIKKNWSEKMLRIAS